MCLFLFGIIVAAESLVQMSIRCNIMYPLYYFRSMAIVCWNWLAIGRDSAGRSGGFWTLYNFLWHFWFLFLGCFFWPLFAWLVKTKILSTEGYANDRRSFVTIFCLTFLLSFSIQKIGSQLLQKLFSCRNEYDIQAITSLLSGISSPRNVMCYF